MKLGEKIIITFGIFFGLVMFGSAANVYFDGINNIIDGKTTLNGANAEVLDLSREGSGQINIQVLNETGQKETGLIFESDQDFGFYDWIKGDYRFFSGAGGTTYFNNVEENAILNLISDVGFSSFKLQSGGSTTADTIIDFFKNETESFEIRYDEGQQRLEFNYQNNDPIFYLEDDSVGNAWFKGDVSAQSFTDRTKAPKETVKALDEVKKIKVKSNNCTGNKCEIDKTTLPPEMVIEYDFCLNYGEDGECLNTEVRLGRDLTYTVSHLIKQNQEMLERVEALEAEVFKIKEK